MEYWYMDVERKGIFYSGWDAHRVYDGYRDAHLNPKSGKFGAVLVSTKRIHVAWTLKLKLYFRRHWYWRPEFKWKYGTRYFHWLFFMIWLEKEFDTVEDKVVKDHLRDHVFQEINNP